MGDLEIRNRRGKDSVCFFATIASGAVLRLASVQKMVIGAFQAEFAKSADGSSMTLELILAIPI